MKLYTWRSIHVSVDRNDKDYPLVVDYVSCYKHVLCCKYGVFVVEKYTPTKLF